MIAREQRESAKKFLFTAQPLLSFFPLFFRFLRSSAKVKDEEGGGGQKFSPFFSLPRRIYGMHADRGGKSESKKALRRRQNCICTSGFKAGKAANNTTLDIVCTFANFSFGRRRHTETHEIRQTQLAPRERVQKCPSHPSSTCERETVCLPHLSPLLLLKRGRVRCPPGSHLHLHLPPFHLLDQGDKNICPSSLLPERAAAPLTPEEEILSSSSTSSSPRRERLGTEKMLSNGQGPSLRDRVLHSSASSKSSIRLARPWPNERRPPAVSPPSSSSHPVLKVGFFFSPSGRQPSSSSSCKNDIERTDPPTDRPNERPCHPPFGGVGSSVRGLFTMSPSKSFFPPVPFILAGEGGRGFPEKKERLCLRTSSVRKRKEIRCCPPISSKK